MNDSFRLTSIFPFCVKIARTTFSISALALALVACGGGSSGPVSGDLTKPPESNSGWTAGVYKKSAEFDNLCAAPRSGYSKFTNEPFPDKKGSTLDEKNFLRSWSYETYLWYEELPDLNPGASGTPQAYFDLLKTNKVTGSGVPKDNFHSWEPTEDAESWEAGVSYDYGIRLKVYSTTPPRKYFVAYVEPGSPAAVAGVKRGAKILKIDNYDLENETGETGINALNERLFPSKSGVAYKFDLQDTGASSSYSVTLQAGEVANSPVLLTKVLETSTGKVGYIVFNSHVEKAEKQWITAIQQFKQEAVSDVILDLRYNGGGLLSIASQVSYMLAGSNVQGKLFYEQIMNSKQKKIEPMPFLDFGLYSDYENLDLPALNLSRVYILASEGTCSASEAIINGLRGANIQVYLIGDTTCGKPYGYYPEDNCGTTYYTIQLKGANAKGFGEYSDGFIPSTTDDSKTIVKGCRVQDDIDHQLGDTGEAMLATALNFRASGVCSASVNAKLQKPKGDFVDGEFVEKEVRKMLILK